MNASPLGSALLIVVSVVAAVGALLWTLRYLGVSPRFLMWTVSAHVVFVLLIGFSVFSKGADAEALRRETIQVVMLPALPVDEPEQPRERPKEVPQVVSQPATSKVTPSPELPSNRRDQVATATLTGGASGLPSERRSALPNLNPTQLGAVGVPTQRLDPGLLGGASVSNAPSSARTLDTGVSPNVLTRRETGDRSVFGNPRSMGRTPGAAPGTGTGTGSAVALPPGSNLKGDVLGRSLRYVADAPVVASSEGAQVRLKFWVTPDGRVARVVIIQKGGTPELERAAQAWVEKIRFAPLDADVEQVQQWGEITVAFRK